MHHILLSQRVIVLFFWTSVRILREKSVQAVSGVVHVRLYLHSSDTQQISLTLQIYIIFFLLRFVALSSSFRLWRVQASRGRQSLVGDRFRCDKANARERNLIHSVSGLDQLKDKEQNSTHISRGRTGRGWKICCVDTRFSSHFVLPCISIYHYWIYTWCAVMEWRQLIFHSNSSMKHKLYIYRIKTKGANSFINH